MKSLGTKILEAIFNIGFIVAAAVAVTAIITLIAFKVEGGYPIYEGYCIIAAAFGGLISVPLGVGAKFIAEDI